MKLSFPKEWWNYIKELKESTLLYIKRDRTKDKKIISPDLTNPTISSQEIAMYDYN